VEAANAVGGEICFLGFFGHVAEYGFSVRGLEDDSVVVGDEAVGGGGVVVGF